MKKKTITSGSSKRTHNLDLVAYLMLCGAQIKSIEIVKVNQRIRVKNRHMRRHYSKFELVGVDKKWLEDYRRKNTNVDVKTYMQRRKDVKKRIAKIILRSNFWKLPEGSITWETNRNLEGGE